MYFDKEIISLLTNCDSLIFDSKLIYFFFSGDKVVGLRNEQEKFSYFKLSVWKFEYKKNGGKPCCCESGKNNCAIRKWLN